MDHGDSLVSLLSDKAQSAGVRIVSISVGSPALFNGELFRFDRLAVSLNLQGPVDSTLFFLDTLQDALPVARVSIASFGALDTPLPSTRVDLEFIIDPEQFADPGEQDAG